MVLLDDWGTAWLCGGEISEFESLTYLCWPESQRLMRPNSAWHASLPCAQSDIVARLSAGARSGRASTAAKALENLKSEGVVVAKPFVPKRRWGGRLGVQGGQVCMHAGRRLGS